MNPAQAIAQLEQLGELGQWAAQQLIALSVENAQLKRQLQEARTQLEQLEQRCEQLQREAHRQAAPFRRPEAQRNPHPARPGRKAGHPGVYRAKPDHIDQQVQVKLEQCPFCQGPVSERRPLIQYIEEIPEVRPQVTQLITEEGWCAHCQREVYSTHPLQVSRASGGAAVQLGPRALGLACDLNKAEGLSMRQTVAVLKEHFGLKITPGGLALLVQRVGRRLAPEYEHLALTLRQSPVVHVDETSWWVGGPGWWLWVFTTPVTTLYVVVQSRGAGVALALLGEQFAGTLVSDCLAIYDGLNERQQKCYSHHLKAVSEAVQAHPLRGEGYLQQVRALLRTALLLKALQPEAEPQRFQLRLSHLKTRAHSLLDQPRAQIQEEKVRHRLWKQRDHLFTFLEQAEVPATNNLAERQLRPAVIARKISCGNKTPKGAEAWQRLSSIAATCRQTAQPFIQKIAKHVRSPPCKGP